MRVQLKKRTLQLFQLLLAVFGVYLCVELTGIARLLLPLALLLTIVILDRFETIVGEDEEGHTPPATRALSAKKDKLALLLHSKNRVVLLDVVDNLLQDMQINSVGATGVKNIDRLLSLSGLPVRFGLRVINDVKRLDKDWDYWQSVSSFEQGKNGRQRALLIVNNARKMGKNGRYEYREISTESIDLLSSREVVALTTLTFYKIYRLCLEKNRDTAAIFRLIRQHPGGEFQLEDYVKKRTVS